jgi:superfamily II DNA or RNA helicase
MKAYFRKKAIEDRAAEKLRVLEDLFRLHARQKTIVFAGSNAMALEVSQRFLLPTILSHTPKRERLAVLDGFASGEFPAIVAKVAVVIGGQASTRQATQRLGRILRPVGESRAVLYEVVCETSGEVERSRKRRRSDAYQRTGHRNL